MIPWGRLYASILLSLAICCIFGDHPQCPPTTRLTIPSWAKRLIPPLSLSPIPAEWVRVRFPGLPSSKKRSSNASNNASGSMIPPPLPDTAMLSPSLISFTASLADMNLLIFSSSFYEIVVIAVTPNPLMAASADSQPQPYYL